MNKAFKGGNALWVVILVISLLAAGALLFLMFQEKIKRIKAEEQFAQSEQAKRSAQIKLDQIQLQLIQLRDNAQIMENRLSKEKENYQALLKEAEQKDAQITSLETNLTNEKRQRTNLANTLARLKENHNSLETKLKQANAKIDNFKEQLAKRFPGKDGVELEKIVVKPKQELSGKVLVVNTEFLFVVVDLGKNDGVGLGDEFAVYQGPEEVGKVRVEKVYDAMSSAAILPGSQIEEILEDSIVKSF